MIKENEDLQKNIIAALQWEPLLKSAEISVTVSDGVVTLSGEVDSYAKKLEAAHAAKHVTGVKGIVENIQVVFPDAPGTDDKLIAEHALMAMKWSWAVPSDKVQVKVENGWLTLSGELKWNYQKEAAKELVKYIDGVKGVTNQIVIKSDTQDMAEQMDIERALGRHSLVSGQRITVHVTGNKVILNGRVQNHHQKAEAERIAWRARGVNAVENELVIEYSKCKGKCGLH